MDLAALIAQMERNGDFATISRNPLAQFGPENRRYLGAELLPERETFDNAFRETSIRYKTIIAPDGSRYSPAQRRDGGQIVGEMLVELGHQDVAREFTGREYDALLRLTGAGRDVEAATEIVQWTDVTVNRALIEATEKQRWEAIVNASVTRTGDNGFSETVSYPNPAGHRAAAAGTWSTDTYDPFADIFAMAQVLRNKGYQVSRIITSSNVVRILAGNDKVAARTGALQVVGGSVVSTGGFATPEAINRQLQANGLPPFEIYDLQYRRQDGTLARFLPDNAMVLVSQTGQDQQIALEDTTRIVPDVLGYTAIGRGVGQSEPGRTVNVEVFRDKPPRIQAEGWQASLPVLTEPEAVAVITTIS